MIRFPIATGRGAAVLTWAVAALAVAAPGGVWAAPAATVATQAACPALLRHTQPRLQDEKPVNLCDHAGRVVLVVNTASECGFTYAVPKALEKRLHETLPRPQDFVVIGFPGERFWRSRSLAATMPRSPSSAKLNYGVEAFRCLRDPAWRPGPGSGEQPVFRRTDRSARPDSRRAGTSTST